MLKGLLIILVILAIIWLARETMAQTTGQSNQGEVVRRPFVADQFYPGSQQELSSMVEKYLSLATPSSIDGELMGLIVPHAGYIYSGPVAAYGFKGVPATAKRIFILGANHNSQASYFKFSLPSEDFYETPLGRIKVSPIIKEMMGKHKDLFVVERNANLSHIIEVELPFLQKKISNFEIVPIIVGAANGEELVRLAGVISSYLNSETLIIVSSDLSHYFPYDEAVRMDHECINAIEALDLDKASRCEACGMPAVLVLMKIAKEFGWKAKILDYRNSGDTAGDKSRVVGYSSIAFYKAPAAELSTDDKQSLLKLARSVLESQITAGKLPQCDPKTFSSAMRDYGACFVTLTKNERLRGCIGDLVAHRPLYESVIDNTVNAALRDTRFPEVAQSELKDIDIEISVLTPPKEIPNEGPEKLLAFLVPNKHGLILSNNWRRATYLPQVWEQLPDKEEFLSSLCRKGGMSSDCWKKPDTKIEVYEAIKFQEKE